VQVQVQVQVQVGWRLPIASLWMPLTMGSPAAWPAAMLLRTVLLLCPAPQRWRVPPGWGCFQPVRLARQVARRRQR